MEAVILAGGKGTRLRPLTDALPKPLVPFMGEPYAAGLLRRLAAVGATRATFLVGHEAGAWRPLEGLGAQVGIDVAVATEEVPLDTAGAARRLLGRGAGGAVVVCNGDILTDLDLATLLDAHRGAGATATIALTRVPDTSTFGVVVCDAMGRVMRFVEKPTPGTVEADTVNAGTYVLEPDVFAAFPGDGPLSFERAVFPGLVGSGATVLGHPSDAHWADLGTPARYLAGHRAVLEGVCRWPDAPGMRRRDGVAVHRTARVDRAAKLAGGTVIGSGCEIEGGARLRDAVLHESVRIGAGATVESAILGPRARVAPGASVGPNVVLGEGAVVHA
ncbi:MAG: NTP transferase domain-containing protein [Nitriliruptorales bacterium]|nr:NTP transferase domain-containing protein [Nitriliruptorales bacterium]